MSSIKGLYTNLKSFDRFGDSCVYGKGLNRRAGFGGVGSFDGGRSLELALALELLFVGKGPGLYEGDGAESVGGRVLSDSAPELFGDGESSHPVMTSSPGSAI